MLTRLEANGFKNLVDFSIDLGPYTCIVGKNASGKSNVFDVIQFLSLLSTTSLMEAAQQVRRSGDERTGDPRDLFTSAGNGRFEIMKLAAEMIVPPHFEDDLGQPGRPTITYLRYEVEIGYEESSGQSRQGRLVLHSESLEHIKLGDAGRRLGFPHSAGLFRKSVIQGRRLGKAFISTTDGPSGRVILMHGDGGSRGRPRPAAAARARATVLSAVASVEDPTALAAKREMMSWRRLALEPSALRAADNYTDSQQIADDGRHLPGSLYRIAIERCELGLDLNPVDVYDRVRSRVEDLVGIRLDELWVEDDPTRETLSIRVRERDGAILAARSLSEGTLRFIALCVLLEDPSVNGLITMEEPENGIHPENIKAIMRLVRDLAVDAHDEPGADNPLRQILVNSHSPSVVQVSSREDLLVALPRTRSTEHGSVRALELLPITGTWRSQWYRDRPAVTVADLLDYLAPQSDNQFGLVWTQLSLPLG